MSAHLSRRDWLQVVTAGAVGWSYSGWLGAMAEEAAKNPQRKRSCILLWMNGGPSQLDTFDLKPGHANGGPFKEIGTNVAGIKISEHLPKISRHVDKMAIIRSMATKEADHGRATYQMRTGHLPGGPVHYPTLGSLFSKELEQPGAELPNFVSIAPYRFFSPAAYGPGFLGPQYAPLVVGEGQQSIIPIPGARPSNYEDALKVQDVDLPQGVDAERAAARVQLLGEMQDDFLAKRSAISSLTQRTAYVKAVTLMRSKATKAFDLDDEPRALRDRYGRNLFGQGCLLARRLIEKGVPFVEVSLATVGNLALGWDTHLNNFDSVRRLSEVLDPAWSTGPHDALGPHPGVGVGCEHRVQNDQRPFRDGRREADVSSGLQEKALQGRKGLAANRGVVGVYAGHLVRVGGGPGVRVAPAPAHADERRLLRQPVRLGEELVPGVPRLAGVAPDKPDVEAPLEQFDFGLRLMVEVVAPPGPRVAGGGLLRGDHDAAEVPLHRGLDGVPLVRPGLV